jgi:hypothetical protein
VGKLPFLSPLIPQILRGYLIDTKAPPDQLLIEELERTKSIPVPLIAMVAVTVIIPTCFLCPNFSGLCLQISHCIQEYVGGFQRQMNNLSRKNLEEPFVLCI